MAGGRGKKSAVLRWDLLSSVVGIRTPPAPEPVLDPVLKNLQDVWEGSIAQACVECQDLAIGSEHKTHGRQPTQPCGGLRTVVL